LLGSDSVAYFREISEVDPKTQTYTAISRNMTFGNYMTLEEKVSYSVAPSQKTLFEQEAAVAVSGYSSVCSYIEEFCVNRFKLNAEKVGCIALVV
jgi:hypothetical protein